MPVDVDNYNKQSNCFLKGEHYSVRDNGAVFRHSKENGRPRKLDNHWTFGTPNNHGYFLIGSVPIHRIVAFAFLGEPPSEAQIVVDHIDTNRKNNRPENLRWVSKLENILSNPITLKKIVFYCGSIEAFLENPSILKTFISNDPNFTWMRSVSTDEAKNSWERIQKWANQNSKGGNYLKGIIGDWIFSGYVPDKLSKEKEEIVSSLTSTATQKDWKTPSEFPQCPVTITFEPIESYFSNIKLGEQFVRNKYSISVVKKIALSESKKCFWVKCKNLDDEAIKPWSLIQITF
ncbi:MAG: HNH endonuclease, partial [Cyclobacteriaceae bacterium]|nr:HNH endonuclease [Cyclobacteriaceae bacterium]